jgi:NAD(P)-dependent dehydrogenase (short-subunit alcohol dehydrogenase family)
MIEQGRGGSIINITSIHGTVGDPNVVAHCASKFGLEGLTQASAEALREYDIRVNAIAPGAIEEDSGDRRGESPQRKVTQADVATLVVYLASDLGRSVTGATLQAFGSTRKVIKT